MENLDRYARFFDTAYPEYTENRYAYIQRLVLVYDAANTLNVVKERQFAEFVELVSPLIAIKNYKSQVPFPEKLQEVIECIINIRGVAVGSPDIFSNHKALFKQLILFQGFQLPTVSAVFHFCHTDHFPIVDSNVEAACALLKERYPNDFANFKVPLLPKSYTFAENKLDKYSEFVLFINRVMSLQRVHGSNPTYRSIDKALMVLGVPKFRSKVENPVAR